MEANQKLIETYNRVKEEAFEEQGFRFTTDGSGNMEIEVQSIAMRGYFDTHPKWEVSKESAETGKLEARCETPLIPELDTIEDMAQAARLLSRYFGVELPGASEVKTVEAAPARDLEAELEEARNEAGEADQRAEDAERAQERTEGKYEGVKEALGMVLSSRQVKVEDTVTVNG